MAADRSEPTPPPRGRILIADYERGTTIPLKFLMEQSGYEVFTASSGAEALQLVEDLKPDLILIEGMLSNPDGFEICQAIRGRPDLASARIIFVSAMTRDIDIARGLAAGADGYITKPFANADVMDHVRKLLELTDGSNQ